MLRLIRAGACGMKQPDHYRSLHVHQQIASYELLIVDELGFAPLSKTGVELLFEMLSQRYERGATMITSNLLCGAPHKRFNAVLHFYVNSAIV